MSAYQVLLYYKYNPVADPESIRQAQFDFCSAHGLLGRILVAPEGINGTVSGLREATQQYMDYMQAHPLFQGIEFKIDPSEEHTFNKLHVRVKKEIVHLGLGNADVNPLERTGAYIEPQAFRELLNQSDEEVILLDARSKYEYEVGKFPNALTLDIENFRDLPRQLEAIAHLKDKKIITYCTGGIKCEKASALLLKEGFQNVLQLHGGIVRYGHEAEGEHFEGACYVFDHRVVVPINSVNPKVIGKCAICETPSEKMINCANTQCNKHFLICSTCAEKYEGTCSTDCHASETRRSWDGSGYYLRGVNSKNYVCKDAPVEVNYRRQSAD